MPFFEHYRDIVELFHGISPTAYQTHSAAYPIGSKPIYTPPLLREMYQLPEVTASHVAIEYYLAIFNYFKYMFDPSIKVQENLVEPTPEESAIRQGATKFWKRMYDEFKENERALYKENVEQYNPYFLLFEDLLRKGQRLMVTCDARVRGVDSQVIMAFVSEKLPPLEVNCDAEAPSTPELIGVCNKNVLIHNQIYQSVSDQLEALQQN